jgi:Putative transposase/Transposase zinc-binding domain
MRLVGRRGPGLADILRDHVHELGPLGPDKRRVVRDILDCRTPVLGGHLYQCDNCARKAALWNSCLNRHCPACGSLGQAAWVTARIQDILPGGYIHIIVTVPDCTHLFFHAATRLVYRLLLKAAAESVLELCRAKVGFTPAIICVMHTWSQKLTFHPHVHCIVSAGGLSLDETQWIATRKNFFLPHLVLAQTFRGKFLAFVKESQESGQIGLAPDRARALMRVAWSKDWDVSIRKPIAEPAIIIKYLARYTRKTAFSNSRLVSYKNDEVLFSYKNRKTGKRDVALLPAVAFIARFLRHVLPRRFVRIRYYGLLAHPVKGELIQKARALLGADQRTLAQDDLIKTWRGLYAALTADDPHACPFCERGRLIEVAVVPSTRPTRYPISSRAP